MALVAGLALIWLAFGVVSLVICALLVPLGLTAGSRRRSRQLAAWERARLLNSAPSTGPGTPTET